MPKENLLSVEREDGQVRMTMAESVLKFVVGLFKASPKPAEQGTQNPQGENTTCDSEAQK